MRLANKTALITGGNSGIGLRPQSGPPRTDDRFVCSGRCRYTLGKADQRCEVQDHGRTDELT